MSAGLDAETKKRKRAEQDGSAKLTPKKSKKAKVNGISVGAEIQPNEPYSKALGLVSDEKAIAPVANSEIASLMLSKQRKEEKRKTKEQRKAAKREAKAAISRIESRPGDGRWTLSDPSGGRFLDAPPIVSADEKYLILANARAVHIYETESSLLVRRISSPSLAPISSFALSATNSAHLYVTSSSGQISLWDWTSGYQLRTWDRKRPVFGLAAAGKIGVSNEDAVYTLERGGTTKHKYQVVGHVLGKKKIDSITILETSDLPRSLKAFLGGRILVVNHGTAMSICQLALSEQRKAEMESSGQDNYTWTDLWREHTWNEFPSPGVTCFDVSIRIVEAGPVPSKNRKGLDKEAVSIDRVDMAIGREDGKILIYEDIMSKLAGFGSKIGSTESRVLHWHRKPVGSVAWTSDARYLISGGQETVLCQWNADNGKRSDLPHLVSPIQHIAVSPKGTSYAVALADNSVIVLSTSEMKPTTNVAGLQISTAGYQHGSKMSVLDHFGTVPSLVDPSMPNQLLVAVPASQMALTNGFMHVSCPYIQRFDISSSRHLMRQAITRNNATTFIDAPNSRPLDEPSVVLMQVSCDGNFLATVDEWSPPPQDLTHTTHGHNSVQEEQRVRRELNLKFWQIDQKSGLWRLITRIEAPHLRDDGNTPGRVFSLVPDPSYAGFATLGEDGYARIWTPKRKSPDGTLIRANSGDGIFWSSRHAVELERVVGHHESDAEFTAEDAPTSASLAFSSDGSILAATQELPSGHCQGLVHMIDAESGAVTFSRAGLYAKGLVDIKLLQRYLIILSQSLTVWDIVNDELVFSLEDDLGIATSGKKLAVNPHDNTFAISFFVSEHHEVNSSLMVFDVTDSQPIFSTKIASPITSLLASPNSHGYVVLDSAAEIRILSPPSLSSITVFKALDAMALDSEQALDVANASEEDDDDEMMDVDGQTESDPATATEEMEDEENDKPVVRPEQLAAAFDVGPSFALPPVRDLFKVVTELYARKTIQSDV